MGANRGYFYTRLYGPHHLWGRVREGSREFREQRGGKVSKKGAKGSKESKSMIPTPCGAGSGKVQGSEGQQREQREQTESKGSKSISILGFRVPTTCGGKYFDDHI